MRARNIKPGFFKNEDLASCQPITRLLFAGLWCMADREGRLEKRPLRIKAEIFPYDSLDINGELTVLERNGFIQTYAIDGKEYLQVNNFSEHQRPHHTEAQSKLPAISNSSDTTVSPPLFNGEYPPDSLIHGFTDSLIQEEKIVSHPDDHIPYQQIIDTMNALWGTAYKSSSESNRKLIRARLAEGYTEEDLITVCRNKLAEWGDDPKMVKYLRPETVFNATKFQGYFNSVKCAAHTPSSPYSHPLAGSDIGAAIRSRKVCI